MTSDEAGTVRDSRADDALGDDDVVALRERLERGEVSAQELREAAIARAESVNGDLNAIVCAVAEVPTMPGGPFAGIPSLIKDNEDVAGYPSLHGSWAPAGQAAQAHSPWVAQYLALGFSPIAKTTLPEFGLTASTESTRFGATRNPWNTGHSVGGSSGGSAALVAAGVVPIAHANDGGGSIRIPAAACGLVGLKPTRGRLVDAPELERLPVNLVTQGVVTRSVRDTALYYAEAERLYANPVLPPIGLVEGPSPQRLRIGMLVTGLMDMPVDPETVAAVRQAASVAEGLGHHVEEVPMPVPDQFGRDFLRYWAFISWLLKKTGKQVFGEGFDAARVEPFTDALAGMFMQQAERLPLSLRRLRRAAEGPETFFDSYDVLLSPVLGHPAPPIGYLGPEVDPREHLVRLLRFASFTALQNVSGDPAISLPLARSSDGLPIGVHFAAPRGEEARLLALAFEFEDAMPWPTTSGQVRK